jgi:hypothetical protein
LGSIASVTPGVSEARFTTSAVAGFSLNEVTFEVQAPSSAGTFAISAFIGPDNVNPNPNSNFVEQTFEAIQSFFVEACRDVVYGSESFDIFGEIGSPNLGIYILGIQISHIDGDVIDFTLTTPGADSNGSFSWNGVYFPIGSPEGMYRIDATLLCAFTFYMFSTTYTKIELRHPSLTLTVGNQTGQPPLPGSNATFPVTTSHIPNATYTVTLTNVSGAAMTGIEANDLIINNNVGTLTIRTTTATPPGTRTIRSTIYVNGVAVESNNFVLTVAEPPATNIATGITGNLTFTGTNALNSVTYCRVTRPRINGRNGTATIAGRANVADASLTIVVENLSLGVHATRSVRTATVVTNATGNFSVTVNAPNATGRYNCIPGGPTAILHRYDSGEVRIYNANGQIIHRVSIFILDGSRTAFSDEIPCRTC